MPATPHPETLALIEVLKGQGCKPYYEHDSIESARAQSKRVYTHLAGNSDFPGKRTEIFVPAPHIHEGGVLPCYVYHPDKLTSDNPPVLVYFHGGGFTVGTRDNVDTLCKTFSRRANCIVVNVEYRLAPENKFPAAFDDGNCVTKWVIDNKTAIGGGATSKVGVSGDSAGAMIAAAVAHDVKGIDFQVLAYPKTSKPDDYSLPSYEENKLGPILTPAVMTWFTKQFLEKDEDNDNPRYSCLTRPSFSHLPPALIIAAELDPIRDDSSEYAKKLEEAGVPTEFYVAKGVPHGFYTSEGHFKESSKEAHQKSIDFIMKYGN